MRNSTASLAGPLKYIILSLRGIMKELTDQDIKSFLENEALYVPKTFLLEEKSRTHLVIDEIDEFCETCLQVRPFHDMRSRGGIGHGPIEYIKTGISGFSFTCVSCRKDKHMFDVHKTVADGKITLEKFGQWPRKKLERNKDLQKFFKDDADCYQKAMVSLSNGYGIAAFAYFRRIVEKQISKLLDLIETDATASDLGDSLLESINNLRKESPMSDKIKIARTALPTYLQPNGLNPLGKLYKVLSEGVHGYSDEECLEQAESTKACLVFLISELSTRQENREKFKKMVGSL